jgi:hypothetical protein
MIVRGENLSGNAGLSIRGVRWERQTVFDSLFLYVEAVGTCFRHAPLFCPSNQNKVLLTIIGKWQLR